MFKTSPLLALIAYASCATMIEDDITEVGTLGNELYVDSTVTWPNVELPVCWATTGDAAEKAWVRSEIERSWEFYADVDFTGWGSCPSGGATSGVEVSAGTLMEVTNGLGTQSDNVSDMELDFSAAPELT